MNKSNDNEAIEGEVIDAGYDAYNNTTQDNDDTVKRSRNTRLSVKADKFAKNYKESETMGNGTQSAIKAGYSKASASVTASRLLKDARVLAILNESVEDAERVIRDLMYTSDSDTVRLAAAKEVMDRTVGKAVQRTENTNLNISVEMMLNQDS